MKKLLLLVFLLVFPFFVVQAEQQKEKAFVVNVLFDQGIATIGNVLTATRFVPLQQAENEMGNQKFWIELISIEGTVLEKRLFDFNLLISAEPPVEGMEYPEGSGGTFELDQAEDEVVLPYHANAKFVFLYDINYRKIDQKDISFLQTAKEEKIVKKPVPIEELEKQNICDDSREKCGSNFWLDNAIYIFLLIGATILWLLFLRRQRNKI